MKISKIIPIIVLTSFVLLSCSKPSENTTSNDNNQTTDKTEQIEQTEKETANETKNENNKIEEPQNCSLVFAGDVLVHSAQLNSAFNPSTNTYNFDESFTKVKDYISSADLAICNSETSYLGPNSNYEGYPTFNSPTNVLDSLKNAGFDILSSAHNHTLDNSVTGFNSTAKAITDKGFDLLGIKNQESDKNYLVKEVNGIKIGFTNFTYCENTSNGEALNGIPIPNELKNRINIFSDNNSNLGDYIDKMKNTISDMKKDGAELIIFYIHWGEEYNTSFTQNQETVANTLNKEGVNIIIGSHPHVVEPIRTIENEGNKTLVCYSLGNFISNQREETMGNAKSADGLMVRLNITKDQQGVTLKSYETIPTWVYKYSDNNGKIHFIILNTKDVLNGTPGNNYSTEVFNKVHRSSDSTNTIIHS